MYTYFRKNLLERSLAMADETSRPGKGEQLDYPQPAVQGVMYVNRLFELEDKIGQKQARD